MTSKAAVIGGGPAGLSAAIGLSRAGYKTTVYEQRKNWSGRVCGAFLNSEAVRHLEWLGVSASGAPVATATLYHDKDHSVSLPMNGLALSRKDLEEVLLNAVRDNGGQVQFGSKIKDPAALGADITVVAGGRYANQTMPETGWYGWNGTFENVPQKSGDLSMHFFPGGYVGIITFADGTSNVCGLFKRKGSDPINWQNTHERAQENAPSLKKIMANARRTSEWRGVGPLPFSWSMRKMDGALLTGDAAAVGDPYMGEGLGRALSAGPMLYQAWRETGGENFTARYEKLWQNHYTSRLRVGHLTRVLLGTPPLFHVAMRLALRSRGSMVRALPIFHRGFHGSNISYS